MNLKNLILLLAACLLATSLHAADATWKAGVARTRLTPEQDLWMAGYGGRKKPAEGKYMDLWAKALALEDARGRRAVIVSMDLLGLPQSIYQRTCQALQEKFNLQPDQVLLAASHTHCGPVLRGALYDIYPLDDAQRALIEEYSVLLESNLVATVGQALADLAPARLAASEGASNFAVNRRANPEGDVPRLLEQGALKGPVDHAVPVLAVRQTNGALKAVVFGYACHCTVMDFLQWGGDYAGFAQVALEKTHPGMTALFFAGCGADQNPLPRRKLELAERYGHMLAAAVEEALLVPSRALPPQLKTSRELVPLNFAPPPTVDELEALTRSANATAQRWSTRLLAARRAGQTPARDYPFPLQVWQLGGSQLLIALGGEPVVDWALKFKWQYGPQTWVAGYCNDVMAYIPSVRVLKEGGYEGHTSMHVYGQPSERWADDIETSLEAAAARLVQQVKAP